MSTHFLIWFDGEKFVFGTNEDLNSVEGNPLVLDIEVSNRKQAEMVIANLNKSNLPKDFQEELT